MASHIEAIAYHLPEAVVTNEQLRKENPAWKLESVEAKSGVRTRHIASLGETSFDLAVTACERLFASTGVHPREVDAVIFCTQSPDYVMPGNAHLIHNRFSMKRQVAAFDITLACSGYIYGLALAHSLLSIGLAHRALVVTADTYSKFVHPKDRSARVLFGDGAAATFLTSRDGEGGILDLELCSSGSGYEAFYVPAGGARIPRGADTVIETEDGQGNVRTLEHIHMDGFRVWSFINSAIPPHMWGLLARHQLKVSDIDHFIFHQASQMTLDSLVKILQLDPARVYIDMAEKGNTVSASIPIALKEADERGVIKRGDRIVLCGFGVGLSYGSILMEY